MENSESLKLNKIKIYRENDKLEALPDNLIIEIDGVKLNGVIDINYKLSNGSLPVLTIKMVSHADIDAGAMVNTMIVDPPGKINNNMDIAKF